MSSNIEFVLKQCGPCQRNQKMKALEHPAMAIQVEGIFDQIGIDLVL